MQLLPIGSLIRQEGWSLLLIQVSSLSQARDSWKLDYAFNASFTSLNVTKVMMKVIGMDYSMASFKSLMFYTYLTKRFFKTSGYRSNRTLISKIFKKLFCLQRKAA